MMLVGFYAVSSRVAAFDGLRGVAAVVVVIYHYICLLHWDLTRFSATALPIVDTPLAILWNGQFAVVVFFVLSGFVMASAAERRRGALLPNAATRYLRLAIPVTVSTILAWSWLTLIPGATTELMASEATASPWLRYTYRENIPGLHLAFADGLWANFLRGYSYFNNVLWTMQIELFGSLMLFVIYWLAEDRQRRLGILASASALIVLFFSNHYLGFVAGACLYEASRAGLIGRLPAWGGFVALAIGVTLGSTSDGFHDRMGLPDWPRILQIGRGDSIWAVLAATCLLYSTMTLGWLGALFTMRIPQFLGRISFALYLVHVPPLYTFVAALHLDGRVSEPIIAVGYAAFVLALSVVVTKLVDVPVLSAISRLRRGALP